MNLSGKTLLITGASRGIGLELAGAAARRGAALVLVARALDQKISSALQVLGAKSVWLIEEDLSTASGVDRLVSAIAKQETKIDIVINNAGLLTGGLLEEQDPDAIDKMLMVNLHAVIRLTRHLLPGMLNRRQGLIINNASVSGKMFFPCASTYAASKAGVVAFTECLRQELSGTGVSAMLLLTPGVKTEMFDDISTLYGKHLNLSFLHSISAAEWAERVIGGIERDAKNIWPSGATWWGVKLAHHFPRLFELLVKRKFQRRK